ncbi:MAG TPA: DUF3341 domain-containing protein, partial [Verrucomicrobiae bacterium]|nr:DUF3341 domain-containing protein [Verrucomicrobiae bacterium]
FVPITFEMTVLIASLSAVLGMLALNGLPMPYHPVFNVERFAFASRDRFFLAIEATDPKFDRGATRKFLEGLSEAIGFHHTRLPMIVLGGGIIGCLVGFGLQYWSSVHYYALNIGGRPLNSWPAFVPITFEMTVLIASLSAVLGMLALNGLPMPYHPVFNVDRFAFASRDRFFLAIEATDPKFDRGATRKFLEGLTEYGVFEVDH